MRLALGLAAVPLLPVLALVTPTGPAEAKSIAAETPIVDDGGAVKVAAELERTILPQSGGETFVRIVLEGRQVETQTTRTPVSLTIVIDESGSMSGEKIEQAKAAVLVALEQLEKGDKLAVVAFSTEPRTLIAPMTIGDAGLEGARNKIRALRALDSTNMVGGLHVGTKHAKAMKGEGRTSRVLLVSDGQPDTEEGLVAQVQALSKIGVGTTTVGIGAGYNEDLMARLADVGLGNYFFAERPEETGLFFAKELKTLSSVVAKEAFVQITPKPGVTLEQVYGYDAQKQASGSLIVPVGDVYSGRRSDLLARVVLAKTEKTSGELVDVKVTYHDVAKNEAHKVATSLSASFSADQLAIEKSLVPAVATKAEKVRTALALEEANAAYTKGDKDAARKIVQEQKMRNASLRGQGAPAAEAAGSLDADLDSFQAEAEAPAADASVYGKKAKASARAHKKY